ncbi:MAG: hypothetical protein AAGG11_12715 [Pseudomonadota bacterium]
MTNDAKRGALLRSKRREAQQLLDESAERDLNDERYDWLRRPLRRRALAIFALCTPIISGFASFFDQPLVALIALLGFGASWFLLKRTTRNIVDLPDAFVDERMLARRGEVYRYAYIGTVTALSLLPALLIGNELAAKLIQVTPFTVDNMLDIVLSAMFFTYLLPAAIFAWTEPEL